MTDLSHQPKEPKNNETDPKIVKKNVVIPSQDNKFGIPHLGTKSDIPHLGKTFSSGIPASEAGSAFPIGLERTALPPKPADTVGGPREISSLPRGTSTSPVRPFIPPVSGSRSVLPLPPSPTQHETSNSSKSPAHFSPRILDVSPKIEKRGPLEPLSSPLQTTHELATTGKTNAQGGDSPQKTEVDDFEAFRQMRLREKSSGEQDPSSLKIDSGRLGRRNGLSGGGDRYQDRLGSGIPEEGSGLRGSGERYQDQRLGSGIPEEGSGLQGSGERYQDHRLGTGIPEEGSGLQGSGERYQDHRLGSGIPVKEHD